jgi:hypothetical protein
VGPRPVFSSNVCPRDVVQACALLPPHWSRESSEAGDPVRAVPAA